MGDLTMGAADGIPSRRAAFEPGALDHLRPAVHISSGINVLHGGTQIGVHMYGLTFVPDAGGWEVQLLDAGRPTDGSEHNVGANLLRPVTAMEVDDHPPMTALQSVNGCGGADLHSPCLEPSAESLRDARIGAGQNRGRRLEQHDLGPEVGKDRSELATSVGRSNDSDALWQRFEGSDVVIGQREVTVRNG
jgi:hypothetical protein